jgi:hypothetical protein
MGHNDHRREVGDSRHSGTRCHSHTDDTSKWRPKDSTGRRSPYRVGALYDEAHVEPDREPDDHPDGHADGDADGLPDATPLR